MALKSLDIYKHLPKTNCKKCGFPTCLAFSMQLASKKASLDQCPDITAEGKAALEGASEPPIRLIKIGAGPNALEIGQETVLFRHDETFYHGTGVAIRLKDTVADLAAAVENIKGMQFERVGQHLSVDLIAIDNASGSTDAFVKAVNAAKDAGLGLVLMSEDAGAMAAALEVCADKKPLIYKANAANYEHFGALAKEKGCPLAVDASDLEQAAELTGKLVGLGAADLVLDVSAGGLAATLGALTKVRRLSLKKAFRPLGYPCTAIPSSSDSDLALAEAGSYIAKYAGIVVVDATEPWQVLPLLTIRQNIYTDPRKPVQVEPKLYQIGAVTDQSPVLITTNFSLTYYTVEGDVEASRIPCYIGVIDTEGTSVLTAWASEKLTTAKIAKLLNSEEVASKVKHKKVIIPGYVSVMSGSLEDDSGWQVMVGPRESSSIPRYLKTVWKQE